jgi:hypothetical protein
MELVKLIWNRKVFDNAIHILGFPHIFLPSCFSYFLIFYDNQCLKVGAEIQGAEIEIAPWSQSRSRNYELQLRLWLQLRFRLLSIYHRLEEILRKKIIVNCCKFNGIIFFIDILHIL